MTIKMYCMCLDGYLLEDVKSLNYIPVGLGNNTFSSEWLTDKSGKNISNKNKYYGEHTFYYWFWKNILPEMKDNTWVGFCGYRHHWSNSNQFKSDNITKIVNKDNFNSFILKSAHDQWKNYDIILGENIYINKWKLSKIIKRGYKVLLRNPLAFLKKNQNIRLNFEVFHGIGNLDKAINLLDDSEKEDFRKFTSSKAFYNRQNMFICRSKKLMDGYFKSVFPWLERCEKIYGFDLHGYGNTRIYGFLAERYMSYWFNKYSKPLSWPIFFYDKKRLYK
jgi:hypothetical protein